MQLGTRIRRSFLAAAALSCASGALAGEIVTTGATIATGDGNPTGVVEIDANAPPAEAPAFPLRPLLGGLGDFTRPGVLLKSARPRARTGRFAALAAPDPRAQSVSKLVVPEGEVLVLSSGMSIHATGSIQVDLIRGRGGLRSRGDDHQLVLRPDRGGASRARFRLKVRGDIRESLPHVDGAVLELRFRDAATDAASRVRLTDDRYSRVGRGASIAARLLGASLALNRLRAQVGGRQRLTLDLSIDGLGARPETAEDLRVSVGSAFDVAVAAERFAPSGDDAFVADAPAPGVERVQLDYQRGRLTLEASGIALAIGEERELTISVALGSVSRSVRVRLSSRRRWLRY